MYSIVQTTWQKDATVLSRLRRSVFIEEQQVPEALEWDGMDESAVHILAWDLGANAIGCARLLPDEGYKLGRMAVLADYRGQGIGMALLQAGLEYAAAANWPHINISSQEHAIGFYFKAGFVLTGNAYMDAGIPHRDMCLYLDGLDDGIGNPVVHQSA